MKNVKILLNAQFVYEKSEVTVNYHNHVTRKY